METLSTQSVDSSPLENSAGFALTSGFDRRTLVMDTVGTVIAERIDWRCRVETGPFTGFKRLVYRNSVLLSDLRLVV